MGLLAELTVDAVKARVEAHDWRGAVGAVGALLVNSGAVEQRYIEAMRTAVEEIGPYIVVAPGIAMPHARPESGVIRAGIALATLARGVDFGHERNDPVDVVIAFAAIDKGAHLATMQEVATMVSDADAVGRLRGAATDEDLLAAVHAATADQGA